MATPVASKDAEVLAPAKEPETFRKICVTLLVYLAALYTFRIGVGDIGAADNSKVSTQVEGE
jgi:hypothetical protein